MSDNPLDTDKAIRHTVAKALGLQLGKDTKRMKLNPTSLAALHYYREHEEYDADMEETIAWSYQNAEADIEAVANLLIRGKIEELKHIFYILWDEDGSPFQRDDPPREILDRIRELEASKGETL